MSYDQNTFYVSRPNTGQTFSFKLLNGVLVVDPSSEDVDNFFTVLLGNSTNNKRETFLAEQPNCISTNKVNNPIYDLMLVFRNFPQLLFVPATFISAKYNKVTCTSFSECADALDDKYTYPVGKYFKPTTGYENTIKITSGCRTVANNAAVDGVNTSMHLQGKAIDVHMGDVTYDQLKLLFKIYNYAFTHGSAMSGTHSILSIDPDSSARCEFNTAWKIYPFKTKTNDSYFSLRHIIFYFRKEFVAEYNKRTGQNFNTLLNINNTNPNNIYTELFITNYEVLKDISINPLVFVHMDFDYTDTTQRVRWSIYGSSSTSASEVTPSPPKYYNYDDIITEIFKNLNNTEE